MKKLTKMEIQEEFSTCLDFARQSNEYNLSADELAEQYRGKYGTKHDAATNLINNQLKQMASIEKYYQVIKNPDDHSALSPSQHMKMMYLVRLITAIALIGGYDSRDDDVRTILFCCIGNSPINEVLKEIGVAVIQYTALVTLQSMEDTINEQIDDKIETELLSGNSDLFKVLNS